MIIYFADRQLNIIGHASTELPEGLIVADDLKSEEIETGIAVFDCKIPYDKDTLAKVKEFTAPGNYLLRSNGDENELYSIVERESNTKKQQVYVYAEDDGLDLLNEVVGKYEADQAYAIDHYINKYAAGAGFEIGINEAKGLTRKLSWDGEATASERIASVATQFDGCEVSYSFVVDGLNVVKKYINIYKERGKDIGITLRLNQDIDSIITTESIINLATALQCTGGTPENAEEPITLKGYAYDDGDFYVDSDGILKSRVALKKWARLLWKTDDAQQSGGHITKQYSYDTTSQATLCAHAITQLKKYRDMEVNYEVDITKFPDNVKIGDRVNIVDDADELYVSARVLKLESSVANQEYKATLGEYLIKTSGIHQKVAELAAQFAKASLSAARALKIAQAANTAAADAKTQADSAVADVEAATKAAEEATAAANTATQSAQQAQEKADNAQAAVDSVEENVAGLEKTVADAQAAADQAYQAAQTAETKATEAQQAAVNAQAKAEETEAALADTKEKAETAISQSETAKSTAEQAKADAEEAATTAAAAKLDAEQAQKDIDSFGEELTTISNTMSADYARKTDLTEATASLQSQITQNAGLISSTVSMLSTIDETANDAESQAEKAQKRAQAAKEQADKATADAKAAQDAADEAAQAAADAQAEADTAKAAADTAQSVADKAEADLAAARADLETVQSRVDATEEEIAEAQQAVEAAQTAADKAKADAEVAVKEATEAQQTADEAANTADEAQAAANTAASYAKIAQSVANEAENSSAAQTTADEAADIAAEAQRTANQAVTDAETAQAKANQAAADAATAQQAADDADARAAQAEADLATAQQNLANVTSRVDATEEEVAAAQEAVETAQAAADKAQTEAKAAQATADTAKANAATAQTAANNAKAAADQAQADAEAAQKAADDAQAAVDALAVRVTTAETKITQNAEAIELRALKSEVTETLGGYYTKEQTDAAIQIKADAITTTVSSTYATKQEVNDIEIGGRNLLPDTDFDGESKRYERLEGYAAEGGFHFVPTVQIESGTEYTLTAKIRGNANVVFYQICSVGGNYSAIWITRAKLSETDYQPFAITFSVAESRVFQDVYICTQWGDGNTLVGDWFEIEPNSLKLEKGNKATDWTPAPEDMASVEDVENVKTALLATTETVASLAVASDNISAEVTRIETTTQESLDAFGANVSTLTEQVATKVSADEVAITVETALENGTGKVVTSTGYTFDEDGMTVQKSGSEMKTQITEDGMTVSKNDEAMLTANHTGVDAVNLHASTYLIVGKNSRFEDYGDNRTGCFWIGG